MKKLRLYNGNIQRIVVKIAEMYGTGYLFRRKMTKLKKEGNEILTLPCKDYSSESILSIDTNSNISSILQSREVHNLASTFKSTNLT